MVRIDAMLVVKVDCLDAQPFERSFACLLHIFRPTVDAALCWILWITHVAELGGDDDAIALSLDRPSNQLFVLERSVHVGGVEHVDAEFKGAMNGGNRLLLVAGRVELRHSHAAEADGECLKPVGAKPAGLRGGSGGTHLNS